MARRVRALRRSEEGFPAAQPSPFVRRRLPDFDPLNVEDPQRVEAHVDWLFEHVGFAFRDDPRALEVWRKAGVKPAGEHRKVARPEQGGHGRDPVRRRMDGPATAFHEPGLSDSEKVESREEGGARDMRRRAYERWNEMLDQYVPPPLAAAKAEELAADVARRKSELPDAWH